MSFLYHIEILRAFKFKSSYTSMIAWAAKTTSMIAWAAETTSMITWAAETRQNYMVPVRYTQQWLLSDVGHWYWLSMKLWQEIINIYFY